MLSSAMQMLGIFLLSQWAMSQFFGSNKTATNSSSAARSSIPSFADRPDPGSISNYSAIPRFIAPMWPDDSTVDISIYVSPSFALPALSSLPRDTLVLEEKNFVIGDYNEKRQISTSFAVPKTVQQNGTLWAHFYMALAGHQLDPSAKDYQLTKANHFSRPLNQYLPKKKVRKLKNLLESTEESEEDSGPKTTIESFYHPNFTISVIPDTGVQDWQAVHVAVRDNFQLEPTGARDASGQNTWYYPVVFMNTFWQLRSHMTELNSTIDRLPLNIELTNMKNWKYSIYAAMDDGMKRTQKQAATTGQVSAAGDGSEFEKFKEILLDTNAYLLGTTFFVSILHMIFEGLAFKNDISHWRKKKDVVGTSVRTILANVVMQTIIFLYLADNRDGTSWMILAGQGFGILLEGWKITKTVDVRLREPGPDSNFSFLPYVVVFEDKHKLTETEKKTQEYDEIAFRYLYIVAVPLLIAYAIYSLVYETHKSWYSFIIETLVGSVYAYGFLMMVPSLYINYRLKSVAHLPGKAMTYKFLNTFIDDLFAFTIRMPTLHRLATLRDDVIFFVWLYQSYKYKVDYTRVNEFGQGGDDEEVEEKESADKETTNTLEGRDTKELRPSAATTSAKAAVGGAQKRKVNTAK
jgi:Cleft lip and palate transmembrane protein 1 (CLPTM1)